MSKRNTSDTLNREDMDAADALVAANGAAFIAEAEYLSTMPTPALFPAMSPLQQQTAHQRIPLRKLGKGPRSFTYKKPVGFVYLARLGEKESQGFTGVEHQLNFAPYARGLYKLGATLDFARTVEELRPPREHALSKIIIVHTIQTKEYRALCRRLRARFEHKDYVKHRAENKLVEAGHRKQTAWHREAQGWLLLDDVDVKYIESFADGEYSRDKLNRIFPRN
jgi:hypothetical protein